MLAAVEHRSTGQGPLLEQVFELLADLGVDDLVELGQDGSGSLP